MKKVLTIIAILFITSIGAITIYTLKKPSLYPPPTPETETLEEETREKELTFTFVGDCVLGTDLSWGYGRHFNEYWDKYANGDYSYYSSGVIDILGNDDYTIANLEGPLTTSNDLWKKIVNFKGDPHYVNILNFASIEAVTFANNHTYDYGNKGYDETLKTLKDANIDYASYDKYLIKEIKGIKVGIIGTSTIGYIEQTDEELYEQVTTLKKLGAEIIIISHHDGDEGYNAVNEEQRNRARTALDLGADIYVGHHPHVLQGIEKYNDKYAVYSLANFIYGGHSNPKDKDSMIAQLTIKITDNKKEYSLNIIPVSISSSTTRNDFRPYILDDNDKTRVIIRINEYSKNLNYQFGD